MSDARLALTRPILKISCGSMKNTTSAGLHQVLCKLMWYFCIVVTVAFVQTAGITGGAPGFEDAFVRHIREDWFGVLLISLLILWGGLIPYHFVKQRGWDERDQKTYKEELQAYRQGYRAGWEDCASGKDSREPEWDREEDRW